MNGQLLGQTNDLSTAVGFTGGRPAALNGAQLSGDALAGISEGLSEFEQALAKDGIGSEAPKHCLVVSGRIGRAQGGVDEDATENAIVKACGAHFAKAKGDRSRSKLHYPVCPETATLHVIIASYGGSLDSAYKSILFLRRFVTDIHVYVPTQAKSAATLMAIGADKIYMSPFAELGPLDTQITDPRNPSRTVSALDCYQSVDYVRNFGLWTIKWALQRLGAEAQTMLSPHELVSTANQFALGAVEPILGQVTALNFGGWGRTLQVGETYARALLNRVRVPVPEAQIREIAETLVYGYAHHPYPIDLDEAESLGLNVEVMPSATYAAAQRVAASCNDGRFIGFIDDAQSALSSNSKRDARNPRRRRRFNGNNSEEYRGDPQASVWSSADSMPMHPWWLRLPWSRP